MGNTFGIKRVKDVVLGSDSPFLVEEMIHEAATILYGRPEAGKTFLALSGAVALSEGSEWLGRTTGEPKKVLYWALDPKQEKEVTRRLRKIDRDDDLFVTGIRPGADDEWWEEFTATLVDTGIEVLFVDNLSAMLGGKSYNSDADVRPALNRLQSVNDEGIAIILIHHAGKFNEEQGSTKTPMGSTAIEAWGRHFVYVEKDGDLRVVNTYGNDSPDVEMGILIDPNSNGKHGAFVTIGGEERKSLVEQWKGDPEELAKNLWEQRQTRKKKQGRTMEQQTRKVGKAAGTEKAVTQRAPATNGIPDQIVTALKSKAEGMSWTELNNAITGAAAVKSKAAESLVKAGSITKRREGKRTMYRLAS